MRNTKFEEELLKLIKCLMEKHHKTGELNLHYEDGSASVRWIGKPDDKDILVSVNIKSIKEDIL